MRWQSLCSNVSVPSGPRPSRNKEKVVLGILRCSSSSSFFSQDPELEPSGCLPDIRSVEGEHLQQGGKEIMLPCESLRRKKRQIQLQIWSTKIRHLNKSIWQHIHLTIKCISAEVVITPIGELMAMGLGVRSSLSGCSLFIKRFFKRKYFCLERNARKPPSTPKCHSVSGQLSHSQVSQPT